MGKPSIMFPKYFFKNAPPFKGRTHLRAKTPNKPHFQEKYFPPFARESPKPDYPGQNCLLSKTYFKGSKRAYSITLLPPIPLNVTSLINPHIRKRNMYSTYSLSIPRFHGCPYGCKWLIIPPNDSSAIPAERIVPRNHPRATHRFQLPWRIPCSSTAKKSKNRPPGRTVSLV